MKTFFAVPALAGLAFIILGVRNEQTNVIFTGACFIIGAILCTLIAARFDPGETQK